MGQILHGSATTTEAARREDINIKMAIRPLPGTHLFRF